MLPNEDQNKKTIQKAFSNEFNAAREMLDLGVTVFDTLAKKLDAHPSRSIQCVTGALMAQVIRRYRSIIAVAKLGHIEDADILTRCLFETRLALRFVIVPQIPKPEWSKDLLQEFKLLCNLSGADSISRFTNMEFRAQLYCAADTLKLNKLRDRIMGTASMKGEFPDDLGARNSQDAQEIEQIIGKKWADRIKRVRSYSGFRKVSDLSEYCDLKKYYATIYSMQSSKSHGEGSLRLLISPRKVDFQNVLRLPGAMVGECLEDVNEQFHLGLEDKIREGASKFAASFNPSQVIAA